MFERNGLYLFEDVAETVVAVTYAFRKNGEVDLFVEIVLDIFFCVCDDFFHIILFVGVFEGYEIAERKVYLREKFVRRVLVFCLVEGEKLREKGKFIPQKGHGLLVFFIQAHEQRGRAEFVVRVKQTAEHRAARVRGIAVHVSRGDEVKHLPFVMKTFLAAGYFPAAVFVQVQFVTFMLVRHDQIARTVHVGKRIVDRKFIHIPPVPPYLI